MGAARAGVAQASGIGAEHAPDLITHAAKNGEDLLLGAPGLSGIIETPMVALHLPRKQRANLIRPAADGDHRVDRTVAELVEMLRAVTGGIEADLREHSYRKRMNVAGRPGTGTLDLHEVAGGSAQDRLGQMAAAGVSSAEDKDGGFHGEEAGVAPRAYQARLATQARQTESITGTSTSTPTIVARAAPEAGPKRVIATATASSKKLLAPISAPGAATAWGTRNRRISK